MEPLTLALAAAAIFTAAAIAARHLTLRRRRRARDVERWLGVERYATGCPHGVTGDHFEAAASAARRAALDRPGWIDRELELA